LFTINLHDRFELTVTEEDQKQSDCRICGNACGNIVHTASEMMFGMRDEFTYLECVKCGTLQIMKIPADLSRYYPREYYSYQPVGGLENSPQLSFKKRRLRRLALNYYLHGGNPLSRYIVKHRPWVLDNLDNLPYYFKGTKCCLGISNRSSILDVGSGVGRTLLELRRCGFNNLTGIDPYIDSSIVYSKNLRVLKGDISSLKRQFDLVMMHHVFEHVPDPKQTLQTIRHLLKKRRYAMIRMPLVSFAWQKYGVNWVQLDPPRHLFLFTEKSFTAMAQDIGFVVDEIIFDSTAFQFWGSEQYIHGIPLMDKRSYMVDPGNSLFSAEQIEGFEAKAAELNLQGKGDQAVFYLRKE
jgi:SAM-dependent methyltransferase